MLKVLPFLSIIFIVGCSNSKTTNSSEEITNITSDQCTQLSELNEDLNLMMECDGQTITESGDFIFSKITNGKTMVSLKYKYIKDNQEKEDYYNGILKENSTVPKLVEGEKYTMNCLLTTAIFEECTITLFE